MTYSGTTALCHGTAAAAAWPQTSSSPAGGAEGFRDAIMDGETVRMEAGWRRFLPGPLRMKWPRPCEAMFESLAAQQPASLMKLSTSGELDAADLTFAAEALGRVTSPDADTVLLQLLTHTSSSVREGVVYGMARHSLSKFRDRLSIVAVNDPSPAVRTAAKEALEYEDDP